MPDATRSHATAVALAGLAALASAMGIGRFAFTPMLPLMQQWQGLSLRDGAWLASANYAGYLAGALALVARPPRPGTCARAGLVAVAITTLAMSATQGIAAWLLLRFLAGVASACVLVGVSTWALPRIAAARRPGLAGTVFAGVGIGIAIAGVVGLWAGLVPVAPRAAWFVLGVLATLACAAALPMRNEGPATARAPKREPLRFVDAALPVACYGAFGFGYIIPATFLPALARQAIPDPAAFGWAWPVFGAAAAASTLAASRWLGHVRPSNVWVAGQLVMAVGVVAPALFPTLGSIVVSALCVGGTFMVVTMAGIQHARVVAGAAAPRLVAAMTAAFATGQFAGPLALHASAGHDAMLAPSLVASAVLVASSLALAWQRKPSASRTLSPRNRA
jgi:MFS family permease